MQANLAVGAAAHLHAALELGLARRPRRRARTSPATTEGGWRPADRTVGPSLPGCARAEVGGTLLALGLRAQDLVGVLDAATRHPDGELVRQEACVQRDVDRERAGFRRARTSARPARRGSPGARAARRAPAVPASCGPARTRPQRTPSMLDEAVGPAHHVALQRGEHGRPLHSKASARGSCRPSTSGSPTPRQKPRLISHCSSTSRAGRTSRKSAIRAWASSAAALARSSSCTLMKRRFGARGRGTQFVDQPARVLRGDAREERGHVPLGLAEAGEDEHERLCRLAPLQPPGLLAHIARVRGRGEPAGPFSLARARAADLPLVALPPPAAAHAQDLHVRGQRLERPHSPISRECFSASLLQA